MKTFFLALTAAASAEVPDDGSVLPFPPEPIAGVTAQRLQDSTMKWPEQAQRLPEGPPNILIVLLDNVGFGVDLGSTVSLDYLEQRPFEFDGSIQSLKVNLKKSRRTASISLRNPS